MRIREFRPGQCTSRVGGSCPPRRCLRIMVANRRIVSDRGMTNHMCHIQSIARDRLFRLNTNIFVPDLERCSIVLFDAAAELIGAVRTLLVGMGRQVKQKEKSTVEYSAIRVSGLRN